MRVEWSKMNIIASFARYIFRTFTSKATFIILCYVADSWLFNDTEIDDLEWPYCLKICFGLGNARRLRLSDKTVRKLAELPIYCQRQKCSPGNIVSGSIRFMQIFAGVRWRCEWGR